ncbi:ATP-grasp domain-containing protein [Kitasatospora sp. NPDC097605]|uniref:ATP-grasp domain-containing protein n=1 Tax=Kitasatospora sp. NPDC097605 TaxID=3157226 RepID=UPI003316CFBD
MSASAGPAARRTTSRRCGQPGRYSVAGSLAVSPEVGPDALAFAADVLAAGGLPSAAVVDVGQRADGTCTWAVVEANPAWASGGYAAPGTACRPAA